MHTTAQGWLVLKLTDSPFYLGLVGFAASLPILLFTLIGGVAADRFHKRKILLATQIIALLLAFL
jgi:MFS family permease